MKLDYRKCLLACNFIQGFMRKLSLYFSHIFSKVSVFDDNVELQSEALPTENDPRFKVCVTL